jgi:oligopeptide transport system substrate-binding protein
MKRIFVVLFALLAVLSLNAQEFTIVNGAEPASIDPHYVEGVPEHRIYMALFEGLTVADPKTNRAIPGIATKWTFNKAMDVVTFTLRKATWSDGVPITADDFVKSWIRKLDPKNAFQYADLVGNFVKGGREYMSGKAGPEAVKIRAVNAQTFEVSLNGPTPFFADVVNHYAFAVVPMHAIAKFGQDWVKPGNMVCNGPFMLSEWKPQEKLVVVPNPKFYDAKNVKLKKITFIPSDDIMVNYNLYKTGAADWIDSVPSELMDEIKLRKDFQVAPEYGSYYFILNVTRKPLDKPEVRKALSLALDRKTLVETVTKGGQIPTAAFVPPSAGFTAVKGYPFNPEEAKKLLAAAGYPGGQGFPKMTILYNTSSNHKRIVEFMQAQWKTNLGIDVDLVNQEWATYLDTRSQSHDFDIARAGWIADYLDPSTFSDMWETGSTQNDGLYSNPKYDAALKLARQQTGATRMKTLMAAEDILINQDLGILPVYWYVTQNMIDLTKWDGWYPNPLNQHPWKFIGPKKK